MTLTKIKTNKRIAKPSDFENIAVLLKSSNLTTIGVKENIENFVILIYQKQIVGVAGYEVYGDKALLRSVAVEKRVQGNGFAKSLVKELISIINKGRLSDVYLLTETAPDFFRSFGFKEVSRDVVDEGIKSSEEFRSICPSTAICMKMSIKK
ncbi:MAG: GNAT family N-acetyltransferase [Calditrichaeota bacterium]|nr:MAG: GNAT family N-acetyltransferase [Calditrichota bacterium]MBL1207263.1 GNAT family N-acetyltransferase [Calditrichota bacterium]NOG47096.1 GNAT family N-acetyltransferase [Calditrichota bacterium]